MTNRIWGPKQHSLHVNRHASFHLHGLRPNVRNGKQAKIQNENIVKRIYGRTLPYG